MNAYEVVLRLNAESEESLRSEINLLMRSAIDLESVEIESVEEFS
jgi:hypothetical protein